MIRKKISLVGLLLVTSLSLLAQSNSYPSSGDVSIFNYSPLLVLQRNTDEGGFIQGIQTKFKNGTNNWYFGNLHSDTWIVSKGDYQNPILAVLQSGNVGIGTVSPGYKLDVIGTIRAREIKVDLTGADFVFENEYNLMPLNELEKFIKINKHLPEIAAAKDMQENGANLGELNTKLLQKIEELTLYTIEQNKKIITLEKKMEKMESALK